MPLPRTLATMSKLVAAAGACVALLGVPATAGAAAAGPTCEPRVSAPVFAQFGDLRDYYLAPGGSFESMTWSTIGNVAHIGGNEPFLLAGAQDTMSVRLFNGGRLTSPKLCVSRDEPTLRFVANAAAGSGQLDVTVRVYDADGKVADSSTGSVSPADHETWSPSRDVDLKTQSWAVGQTGYVDVSFRSQGDWLVDDVFIDPYRY